MKEDKKTTNVRNFIAKRIMDADIEVVMTADYIANKYGNGLLNVDHMAEILMVKKSSVLTYINQHKMPFDVTKIGDKWFTTPFSVAKYVIENRIPRNEFVNKAS
jgi:hypothetical protein